MNSLAYWALWLFIYCVPWQGVILSSAAVLVTKATGALAIGVGLFAVVVAGRVRRWSGFQVAAVLFVAYAAVEFLFFHSGEKLPNKFWTFVQLLLVVLAVWELAPSWRRQRGLLFSYVAGAYTSALANVVLFHSAGAALRRVAAGGADPNELAMTLVLALPMAWFLATTSQRPLVRWICRSYLPVGLFSVALTASRGGMLAAFVALLIVPLTMTKLSPGRLAGAIAMLGLAGVLAVMYVPDTVVQRLASTGSSVQGLGLGGRFRLWVAGFHVFIQKPVFGWGTGTYKLAITPEMGANAQVAHSSFMSLLVEQGAIGFFIYMVMLLAIFRAVLTLPSFERRLGLTLYATLIVSMLPLTWEHSKPVWVVMALLVGMSATELRWLQPAPQTAPLQRAPRPDWRVARPVAPAGMRRGHPRQDPTA